MKKYIYLLLCVLCIDSFYSCQNDDDDLSKVVSETRAACGMIVGQDGLIKSPEWLAYTADTVAARYVRDKNGKLFAYPFIYYLEYEKIDYYVVCDHFSSLGLDGEMVFSSNGEKIEYDSDLFNIIVGKMHKESNHLVWWPMQYIELSDIQTRAFGSQATVTTPNGSVVSDTWYCTEEHNATTIHHDTTMLRATFPEIEFLDVPTYTYNCHDYAWNLTEGGARVWMGRNSNPTHVYWNDGSYVQTVQSLATKVSYSDDNHSAITTETTDVFISKWGNGPVVKHRKDRCPYVSTNLKYYKAFQRPAYYVGRSLGDYDPNYSVYISNGNGTLSIYAFSNATTPTRYEWSAVFHGDCDRYYIWPSNARADLSVYLNNNNYGGTLRVECKMYNGSTLLETCYFYFGVYNQQRSNINPKDKLDKDSIYENINKEIDKATVDGFGSAVARESSQR